MALVEQLGLDLGRTRMRLALAERQNGSAYVRAVATRPVPQRTENHAAWLPLVGAQIEEMRAELGTKAKRCIAAIGADDGMVRLVRFPRMSWIERRRAARFEAQRFSGWQGAADDRIVRVHPAERASGTYAVGVASAERVRTLRSACKDGGLELKAIDHDGFAYGRVFRDFDALVDIGAHRSTLHVFGQDPFATTMMIGGDDITRGIADDLAIDLVAAERRKRILGTAGAGMNAQTALVCEIAAAVQAARARSPIARIGLVGNGSRLPGLADECQRATGVSFEMPIPDALGEADYPADVLRIAGPDWALAVALATRGNAT